MKSQNIKDLYIDLKNFGLNPYDWVIQRSSQFKVELCHIEMPDLKIYGIPLKTRSKFKWKSLELIEL